MIDQVKDKKLGHFRSQSQSRLKHNQKIKSITRSNSVKKDNFNIINIAQKVKQTRVTLGIPYLQTTIKKSQSLKSVLNSNRQSKNSNLQCLASKRQRVESLRNKNDLISRQAKQLLYFKQLKQRQQINKLKQQIEQEHKRRAKLHNKNLKREKTANSQIFKDRKQSINMMRNSRVKSSQSEKSLANQSLRQTIKNFKLSQQKRRLENIRKKYEIEYRKSFRNNKPKPRQLYPDDRFYQQIKLKQKQLNRIIIKGVSKQSKPSTKVQIKSKGQGKTIQKSLKIESIKPMQYISAKLTSQNHPRMHYPKSNQKQRLKSHQINPEKKLEDQKLQMLAQIKTAQVN